ncbi:hypothetical protein BH24ACT23_BH24ACT23_00490 [soil metagenome]
MDPSRRRTLIAALVALVVAAVTGLVIGLAEDDPDTQTGAPVAAEPAPEENDAAPSKPDDGTKGSGRDDDRLPPPEDDPEGLVPGPSGPAPSTDPERAAARAARTYVRALTQRDESTVCAAFAPEALDGFDFPRGGPGCESAVNASLGFAKKGRPKWQRSVMTRSVSAKVSGDAARVVATVFTVYRDVREPTIEDDIVYLNRAADSWLIAKPSATFYRAVGIAEIPTSVIAPPG